MSSSIAPFKDAFYSFRKNWIVSIPFLILLLLLTGLSYSSLFITPSLRTNTHHIIWVISYALITFILIAYVLAGNIALCSYSLKNRLPLRKAPAIFFASARKHVIGNTLIIISLAVFYALLSVIIGGIAFFIGKFLTLDVSAARALYVVLLFLGMAGTLLFFSVSSFFLVVKNLSVMQSFRKSILFVKGNYLQVLSSIIFLFVMGQLILFIPSEGIQEVVNSLLLYPYTAFLFTRLTENSLKRA